MTDITEQFWGYHLILDVRGCDVAKVTNPEYIQEFIKGFVKIIGMVPFEEAKIVHFAKHDPGKAGWTLFQLIETSHIACEFLDFGDAYFSMFSCEKFDVDKVIGAFEMWFNPESIRTTYLTRQA